MAHFGSLVSINGLGGLLRELCIVIRVCLHSILNSLFQTSKRNVAFHDMDCLPKVSGLFSFSPFQTAIQCDSEKQKSLSKAH